MTILAIEELVGPPRPDWHDQAACGTFYVETGYDAWYGLNEDETHNGERYVGGSIDRGHRDWARTVCGRCPVVAECLEFALTDPAGEFGIWGGLMPEQIRKLRRERAAKAAQEREEVAA